MCDLNRIRRNYNQIKDFKDSLSFTPSARLPALNDDKKMYLRIVKYIISVINEIKTPKDTQKLHLFLEAVYNLKEENKMGEVIKCGWARKKTGGRYKGSLVFEYLRTNLE